MPQMENIIHLNTSHIYLKNCKFNLKLKQLVCLLPSQTNGESIFQLVKNAPAFSGLKKRKYHTTNPEIEEITVNKRTLDWVISINEIIHFKKIDMEGGEFDVLKGVKNLLIKDKPIILFECGKGASDFYGTNPNELYLLYFLRIRILVATNFLN